MNAEQIFHSAIEMENRDQRREFLELAFREHPQLQTEVESLLHSHESAGNFLSSPAAGVRKQKHVNLAGVLPGPGQQIGPFRLEHRLGEGGMGIVYSASQETPVRRKVALKIIRPGLTDRRVLDRFSAEREALAIMDHPNIARIVDAGVYQPLVAAGLPDAAPEDVADAAHPYFVMELIEGVPITRYADQNRLTPRQRLELVLPVCDAVQHAHQKGIIHRDLKPSNILVSEIDGRPVPKIIDFGVAKAVGNRGSDQSVLTGLGQVVGTLEYMSPEQAGLNLEDIDTRTDIYALGVLLYELLTGTPPLSRKLLADAAFVEIIRVIREVEPQKPSTRLSSTDEAPSVAACRNTEPARLTSFVRGELDWIAMKALEKDRARRYQSAHELAADLQRFLNNEPVLAGPPSAMYRLKKYLRRNRLPAALAALAIIALAGGSVGTTVGMLRARRESSEKAAALEQVKTENEKKTRALISEQKARAEADEATDRAVLALQTLTDEAIDRLMSAEPDLSADNREFLNQIIGQLEQFTAATDNSVKARVTQADGLNQIGNLKGRLGDLAGAIAAFRKAVSIWEPLCEERTDKPEYRRGMGDAWSNLGIYLAYNKQFEESEQAHRQAIAIHDLLAAEFPDNLAYQSNCANVRNSFGVMLKDVQRNAETVEQYKQAIEIYKRVLEKAPEDAETISSLTNVQNNMGLELFIAGKADQGIAATREVIEIRKRIASRPDASADERYTYPMSMVNLAMMLRSASKLDEAVELLRQADSLTARVIADFPAVPEYRDGYANMLNLLATLYSVQKKSAEGIDVCERCIQLFEQLNREFTDRADYFARKGHVYSLLAVARERNQDTAGCRESFTAGLVSVKAAADLDPDNAEYQFQLANLHVFAAKRLAESDGAEAAAGHWADARKIADQLLASDPADERARKLLDSIPPAVDQ
jgi:eukaryotic-like serine/threonine-protein kinase